MNTVSLMGRLTKDPELRHTPSGTAVAEFGLAVDRAGPMEGDKPGAGFFDCTAWGRTAEVISQYVSKGDQIGVFGELRFEKWEKDDQTRTKVKVNARGFTFGAKRGGGSGGGEAGQSQGEGGGTFAGATDDDIPF